jgi:NTE family protein
MDANALRGLPLFADVGPSDLAALDGHLRAVDLARGAQVFRRGDVADALYVVLRGQVALEIASGARADLLALAGPGDWFGEMALLTGAPRSADARVTVDATLLRVDRDGWLRLADRVPRVFARLSERLSHQLAARNAPAPARRTVVACGRPGEPAPWIGDLAASIRRQVPRRELHVVDARDADALRRALAAIVAPDALVLAPAGAADLATATVVRTGATEWRLSTGASPRVAGTTPEDGLARVARRVAGAAVGLALGAGGAFGLAHLGVLDVLARARVPVDVVAGASMGAIVGALHAAGVAPSDAIATAAELATRFRSVVLRDLDLRGRTLLTGEGVQRILAGLGPLGAATFADLVLPFAAVAMDVATGDEIVLDSGPVLDGIRPSYAMPGIFPSCERDGRVLIDGAMVDPVPVARARALGADVVVAVQPIPPLEPGAADPLGRFLGRANRIGDLLPLRRLRDGVATLNTSLRSFQALWYRLATSGALAADAAVTPDCRGFWFLGFGAADGLIEAGRRAAETALPTLRARLAERVGLVIPDA